MPPRILLLQIRDADDPMGPQELACFRRRLPSVPPERIRAQSLLFDRLRPESLEETDIVMIGGAGTYSCVDNRSDWFRDACRALEGVLERDLPLFASCWGIQALGVVLGVRVVHDRDRREVGTFPVHLTEEGQQDPLFSGLPPSFPAQLGHEDRLESLPPGAVHLAFSDRTPVQSFRLEGRPVYATQFHPELTREENLERLQHYRTKYHLDEASYQAMAAAFRESPHTPPLMERFLDLVWTRRSGPAPGASGSPSSARGA